MLLLTYLAASLALTACLRLSISSSSKSSSLSELCLASSSLDSDSGSGSASMISGLCSARRGGDCAASRSRRKRGSSTYNHIITLFCICFIIRKLVPSECSSSEYAEICLSTFVDQCSLSFYMD